MLEFIYMISSKKSQKYLFIIKIRMEHEASWTKQISSEQVCSFFYIFAIIYATIGVLSILSIVFIIKLPLNLRLFCLSYSIITSFFAFTTALFHYLICQRALLNKE